VSRGPADTVDIATYDTGPREVLAIGIPSFGLTHLFFTARLLNLRMPMNRIVRWFFIIGREVGHARNEIAAKALAIEEHDPSLRCTKLLFLDDDLLFHPDLLLKLDQHQRPIVSGLYYTKTSVPTPLILHGEFGGTARSWTPGDVVPCDGHGMGLCLLDTDVLRRVRDEMDIGVDSFKHPNWFETVKDGDLMRADGTKVIYNGTEDWSFLQKARTLGYQPVVDTSAQTFAWHLDAQKSIAYPQKQWDEFIKTGRVTWPTDGEPVVWENAA
jgi:hypothetical protein